MGEDDKGKDGEGEDDGRVPKELKPFVEGTEALIDTANRLSAYEEGEMLFGIELTKEVLEKAAKVREEHRLELARYVWEAVGYADEDRSVTEVERCIKILGATLEISDDHGRTPIHVLAAKNFSDVLQIFMDNEVDIHAADKWGRTALFEASARGADEAVELLMTDEDIEVNATDDLDYTPLYVATANGHVGVMKQLLKNRNIEVDVKDEYDATPLHLAAEMGLSEAVALLLRGKADPNHGNHYKHRAIHFACQKGYDEIVEELIRYRADVNVQNKFKQTPLIIAFMRWQKPAEEASEKKAGEGKDDGEEEAERAEAGLWQDIIERLLEIEEIDIDAQDEVGRTALHIACDMNQEDNAIALMEKGASCELKTKAGKTCLDICKDHSNVSLLGQLREILDEREEEARAAAEKEAAEKAAEEERQLALFGKKR